MGPEITYFEFSSFHRLVSHSFAVPRICNKSASGCTRKIPNFLLTQIKTLLVVTPGTGNTQDVCSCKLFTLADHESEQIVSERLFPLLNCKRVNPHWAINTLPSGTRRWNFGMQRHDLIGRQSHPAIFSSR